MLGLRQIRRKIRSAGKIEQITKTMQMVAASRFRRCEEHLGRVRPYLQRLEEVLQRTTHGLAPEAHPLLRPRQPRRIALVLITSDRGLCGAYNTNLLIQAARFVREAAPASVALVCVGRRGRDATKRQPIEHLLQPVELGGRPDRVGAARLADRLLKAFQAGEVDAVYLLYTAYLRAFTFKPVLVKLLDISPASTPSPLGTPPPEGKVEGRDYLFEPSQPEFLDVLLPHYVTIRVYGAMAEAMTAENSARMMAMKNATDNAGEMIDRFTLLRNKARQAAITKEIAEIVTAAEALA